MINRSLILNIFFICLIICFAVIISVRGKWSALEAVADHQDDVRIVKHTGYYDSRAITGADGATDIPTDRVERNPYSAAMIGDMRGTSTTSSTMVMP